MATHVLEVTSEYGPGWPSCCRDGQFPAAASLAPTMTLAQCGMPQASQTSTPFYRRYTEGQRHEDIHPYSGLCENKARMRVGIGWLQSPGCI